MNVEHSHITGSMQFWLNMLWNINLHGLQLKSDDKHDFVESHSFSVAHCSVQDMRLRILSLWILCLLQMLQSGSCGPAKLDFSVTNGRSKSNCFLVI